MKVLCYEVYYKTVNTRDRVLVKERDPGCIMFVAL